MNLKFNEVQEKMSQYVQSNICSPLVLQQNIRLQ